MHSHPRALRALPAPRQYPRNKETVLRKLLIGAITGAVMLAVAAIALAATEQTYSQKYVNKNGKGLNKVNSSVGTFFKVTAIDHANTANNEQPSPAREVKIAFPAGSKIDQSTVPYCARLDESATEVCPKNTKIGGGSAEARIKLPGYPPIPAKVTAYNRRKGLFLYIVPQAPGQAPIVLKPTFKGLLLITKIAPLCVAGDCAANGEAVLTKFQLTTKPFTKAKKTFIKAPPNCPKAGWKFEATFKYADKTSKTLKSFQTCRK
jgi:hypothetical protein